MKQDMPVNMGEGSLKLKVLERGHRGKSFIQLFTIKTCFKSALIGSKVCAKSIKS